MSAVTTTTRDGLPRLAFEDIEPQLQKELGPTVERLGYFGEFFQVFAQVPGAVSAFMAYTKTVKAPLDDAQNELLALAVCCAMNDRYECVQHERLVLKLGFTREWIAAAEGRADCDPGLLSPSEAALRRLALAVLERQGSRCSAEVADVAALIGAEKAAAALLQVTRFVMIATLCNALSLSLPVPSIFSDDNGPD